MIIMQSAGVWRCSLLVENSRNRNSSKFMLVPFFIVLDGEQCAKGTHLCLASEECTYADNEDSYLCKGMLHHHVLCVSFVDNQFCMESFRQTPNRFSVLVFMQTPDVFKWHLQLYIVSRRFFSNSDCVSRSILPEDVTSR